MSGFKFILLMAGAVGAYLFSGIFTAIPVGVLAVLQFIPGLRKVFGVLATILGVIGMFTVLGYIGGGLLAVAGVITMLDF